MSNAILLVVVLVLLGAVWFVLKGGKASPEQVQGFVSEGATIVDVRTPGEFASGHHARAVNIPLDQIAARASELGEGTRVVVYCRSGARSARAAQILRGKGFQVLDAGTQARIPS